MAQANPLTARRAAPLTPLWRASQDSQKTLQNIYGMLEQPRVDYNAADQVVHQLKGSSASFGARAITNLCMQLRHAVQAEQREEARALVRELVQVRHVLLDKLTAFCQLEDAVRQGGGA